MFDDLGKLHRSILLYRIVFLFGFLQIAQPLRDLADRYSHDQILARARMPVQDPGRSRYDALMQFQHQETMERVEPNQGRDGADEKKV